MKDNENHLHCAGSNVYGDCGVNSTTREIKSFVKINSNEENQIETVDNIQLVTSSLTAYHTIVMTSTGDLYSFGANDFGQLCLGFQMSVTKLRTSAHKRIAQRVPESSTAVFNGQSIVDITTGTDHCLFLTESGAVYGCGSNTSSQLGFPSSQMSRVLIPTRVEFPSNENENASGNGSVVRITKI